MIGNIDEDNLPSIVNETEKSEESKENKKNDL